MKSVNESIFAAILIFCSFEPFQANEFADSNELPIINTNLGRIQGRYLKSRLGVSFLAFRGIRYAKAPVDDLRFQVIFFIRFAFRAIKIA